ncbi:hypothetical protein BD779DRAFT_1680797 [Infundibulicybe gibba]|nr:hypothetical protein BD779DRAFT_1680797 [Infundibulicybe gibba]
MDFNKAKGLDSGPSTPRLRNPDLLAVDRKKALPDEPPAKSWRKKRGVIAIVLLLLVGAVVGGVVGGLKAKKNKKSGNSQSSSADTTSTHLASQNIASSTLSSTSALPSVSTIPLPTSLITAFRASSWIWATQPGPLGVPPGEYAFRKTILAPAGKTPTRAVVLISVDNEFSLYHNGHFVTTDANMTDSWKIAIAAQVVLDPNGVNVLAVRARNLPDPVTGGNNAAGLLASVQVDYADGSSGVFSSDATWRGPWALPVGLRPWGSTIRDGCRRG